MKTSGKYSQEVGPLLAQTRELLRHFHLKAKKGLGQRFLIDEEVLRLILSTAQITPDDVVIEVGPGLGVLTRELAKEAGRVVAIELDNRLAAILKQTFSSSNNVTIINEDVLKIVPAGLLQELKVEYPPEGYKVVANLPYYITSPVLRHFLEAEIKPCLMVVMVQKEVAEEITAKPGQMSLLSVSVQFYGEPIIAGYVPAQSFYPVPEVDSALLKIVPYTQMPEDIDTGSFFLLVRAGFSSARKQIANSLTQGLGITKAEVLSLLEKAEILLQRRAETFSIEEWVRLWRVYVEAKK
jgi:16S rRNA (adenine1518-N6/adenine1519-N6)-dimethyltransferase